MKRLLTVLCCGLALAAGSLDAVANDAVFRPGDLLEMRIGGVPPEETSLITGQYTVDEQGFINLPHIGPVRAAGLTQNALQQAIQSRYKSEAIYTNPTITISVPATLRFVNVSGDVRAPRRVEYTADLTLLGAISAAGGFTEYADQGKVRLLRDGKVMIVNVKQVRRDPTLDVKLRPGDQIEVPQSWW